MTASLLHLPTEKRDVLHSLLFPTAILTYHRISRTKKNSKMCEMVTDTSDSFTISHSFTTISVPGGAGEREREFEQERAKSDGDMGQGGEGKTDLYRMFTCPVYIASKNVARQHRSHNSGICCDSCKTVCISQDPGPSKAVQPNLYT